MNADQASSCLFGGIETLRRELDREQERIRRVARWKHVQNAARERAARQGRTQCRGKTKAGSRCTRPALPKRKCCGQHQKSPRFKKADRVRCGWIGEG